MDTPPSLSQDGLSFLEKYFRETEFALTRHHIDGYEHCLFSEIPSIIHSNNPIVFLKEPLDKDAGVFAYRVEIFIGGDVPTPSALALTISPPIVTVDGGKTVRRMFPNEARLRNLTYSAQISADIQIRLTTTTLSSATEGAYETKVTERPLIRGFPLFKLPILLRSKLCPTSVADPLRLEEMGECRNDYGGYFIIGGAEKLLITREEQAFNSLYVDRKPDPKVGWTGYASVVSLNPETKQTRRVALYQMPGGEIRVAIPMVRGAFPLFILFRALGVESDEEIVRMIYPAANPLEELLVDSIEDAYPIHNRYTAIQYIKTLTKGFTEAHVLDILQNLMLPHVPDEPLTRAQYLAEMTREMFSVLVGNTPKTNRDDMRNQRFLHTGILVRELFNASWKDWRAAVILTIDRTYRGNKIQYAGAGAATAAAGPSMLDLFVDGNLINLFQPETLNKSIMRGFRGRWGTNENNEKSGVLQPVARISYLDALSHTRRVVSDVPAGGKLTAPRKLDTSQIGYFCTSETPTGAHIGLTKNISMMTQFSFGAAATPLLAWLRLKGGMIPVAETTAALRATAAIVQINGGTVGFTVTPQELVHTLRLFKWNSCLSPTASISFNSLEKTVRIFLDEGRPIRPLWHLGGEGAAFLERLPALRAMSWQRLVFGDFPGIPHPSIRSVAFLDPLGAEETASFTDYEELLTPTAGFIEYCDPMEMNEAYIAWWGGAELTIEHSHCEIHPSTMTGLMASMIPYSNHNQAPRNQLSNSQSKQGIGYMVTNIKDRYDTYSHMLCYGEAPVCRTFYYDTIANGEMPYGSNCIIAATAETGYNQDDGLIVNRDSVARGMFQSLAFRSYDCAEELDPRTKVHSHVANPAAVPTWKSLRPGMDYSRLDERGIIREGEIVDDNTVLVGRYMVLPETNEVKDASVSPGLHTQGRVDSVAVLNQGDGRLLVKVRIIEMRDPVLGDKFSSRHGQKGTIGMFVSAADLPRTADGIVPDIMVNPGGLISRMTVAQLVEMVAGRVGVEVAAKLNATTFCNGGEFVTQLGDVLQSLGCHRSGDNVMYSGITGVQLKTDIFMCPLYFMRLKHLTEDKVNSRATGRREIRTHQPTGGRANEGGLRIGEMERDSLCAHGISAFLQESMMKRGDATDFWICNGCGQIPIYNEQEGLFVCPSCDGPIAFTGLTPETLTLQLPTKQSRVNFSKVSVPYALKLVDQEMVGMGNFGMRFLTEGGIARLRDNEWSWPTEDVDFEMMAATTVTEGGFVNPDDAAAAEAEAAAAAAAAKPKRKKEFAATSTAVAVAVAAPPTDMEAIRAAAATVAAASEEEAGAGSAGAAAPANPALTLSFNEKMGPTMESGLSNHASAAFVVPVAQMQGPAGLVYPDLTVSDWPTVEHYYQAMKFPQDPEWQMTIRTAPTPGRAKKMGLDPAHPIRADWDSIKETVMKSALLAKFRQNPILLSYLQSTAPKSLRYTSTADPYWGVGARSTGRNRLGLLLEEVRNELKDVRVDQALIGAGSPAAVASEEKEDDDLPSNAAEAVAAAQDMVADVTGGQVQAVPGLGAPVSGAPVSGAPVSQQGGVYLFVNPMMRDAAGERARSSRSYGGRSKSLAWEGMSVSRDEGNSISNQEGGGEQLRTDTGQAVEVTVQKLE
jgi:DNA-directed RNA polymerase II subunit RPB2